MKRIESEEQDLRPEYDFSQMKSGSEILEAIREPVSIVEGNAGELLAVRELELGKYMVVVYREVPSDGFVITAFLTRRIRSLERRKQLWPQQTWKSI